MTPRELKLDQKQGCWTCSRCEWSMPDTKDMRDVEFAFEAHFCREHPNKKSREDVNQAAFRIVREATKD